MMSRKFVDLLNVDQKGTMGIKPTLDIDSRIRSWKDLLSVRLQEIVPPQADSGRRVHAAMNYAVQGGQLWRPLLLISVYEEVAGKNGLDVIDAACAVELIHCCAIILDDLPFVDNNTVLRRAKAPCHVVYGPAEAIYASHLLYALAERLSCENALRLGVDDSLVRQETTKLREDLIEAQVLESNFQNHRVQVAEASLSQLYKLKGSLFVFAASLAAILGRVPNSQRGNLVAFARCLGIAYQIRDDILDVDGESSELGKPSGMDRGKFTLASEVGLNQSSVLMRNHLSDAERLLELAVGKITFLHDLLREITYSERLSKNANEQAFFL